jgi:hypothetical protein
LLILFCSSIALFLIRFHGYSFPFYLSSVAAAAMIAGSVKGSNAAELMGQPDIDGALVGGAALVAKEFVQIYNAAPKAKL